MSSTSSKPQQQQTIAKNQQLKNREDDTPQKKEYMKIYSRNGEEEYQKIADSIALDCRSNFINVRQQWLGDSSAELASKPLNQNKLDLLYPDSEVFNSIARKSYGRFLLAQSKQYTGAGSGMEKIDEIDSQYTPYSTANNYRNLEQQENLHTFGDSIMDERMNNYFLKQ